jgi:hypothetical protein
VTVVSLPGRGHGEAIARSDLALPHSQRSLASNTDRSMTFVKPLRNRTAS